MQVSGNYTRGVIEFREEMIAEFHASKVQGELEGSGRFDGKVKLHRSDERLGVMRARMLGVERATGSVVVFLDAHCECNHNWLPPLLSRIKTNQ